MDLPARLLVPGGEITVRVENLSAGGALLCVAASDLCWIEPLEDRSILPAVAGRAFGPQVELVFVGRGVIAQARLVRMTAIPDATDRIYFGCRFLTPLGPLPLRRLGLSTLLATPLETARAAPVNPAPEMRPPMKVYVTHPRATGSEEACTGSLNAVGDHLVTVHIAGGDAGRLAGKIGGGAVQVDVRDGAAPLWSARAHMLWIRVVESPLGVEVGLLADQDPRAVLGPRLTQSSPATA